MIVWATPQITMNSKRKAKPGDFIGSFEIRPSQSSIANGTCDMVTDIIVIADAPVSFNIFFFATGDFQKKEYLGGHSVRREMFIKMPGYFTYEYHNIRIPIVAKGAKQIVSGVIAVPASPSQLDDSEFEKDMGLTIKVGIERA